MDLLSVFICLLILSCLLSLVLFLFLADADLTLLYYEKFGVKPSFHGEVIWITGASSGIGEELAQILAHFGAKVVLSGRNVEKLEEVKSRLATLMDEDNILVLPFNVEDFSVHDECVEKILSKFGFISILVNNAGVSQRADFADIDIEVDQKLFNINVFASVSLARKVLPQMRKRGKGQIVVTSSLAGKIGAPFSSSYTGSKHALHGYFECLRTETIQENINICIACPGPVFSRITSRCLSGKLGEIHNEIQLDKRMETSRCSHLMAIAMANKLDECWICKQPLLFLFYLSQYMPSIFKSLLLKTFFSRKRVEAFRRGE